MCLLDSGQAETGSGAGNRLRTTNESLDHGDAGIMQARGMKKGRVSQVDEFSQARERRRLGEGEVGKGDGALERLDESIELAQVCSKFTASPGVP